MNKRLIDLYVIASFFLGMASGLLFCIHALVSTFTSSEPIFIEVTGTLLVSYVTTNKLTTIIRQVAADFS